jgi:hypothetical protein
MAARFNMKGFRRSFGPGTTAVFALALAAASLGGCGQSGPSAPEPARAWNWDAFPVASQLLVAQIPASVVAVRAETVRAPVAGILRLLPSASASQPLAAGTAWGTLDPEDDPAEVRGLEQARRELEERRTRYRAFDLPGALERLDSEIAAAKETLALARFAERSPELFQGDTPLLNPRLKPAITPAEAAARLRAAEDRRKALAAGDPAADPADLQGMAAVLESRQRALDESRARLLLAASIPGTLRLALSPEADGVRVGAGEVLATVEDDSELEVVVRGTLPLLHDVPAGELFCTVAAAGGTEATASFLAWGVESSGTGVGPVIRFRLPAGAFAGESGILAGAEVPALVFVRLPAPARIVPKLALAEWDADGLTAAGWRPAVLQLFPGSRFLAEGRAAVAIAPR